MAYLIHRFWRHAHRWISLAVAAPFLVTLVTGILLSTRGFNTWVQPSYPTLTPTPLTVSFPQLLEAARSVPAARVREWADISQIDVRPKTGQIRLRSVHDHWEIQVDGASGRVVQAEKRRVSWLTGLHEGASFGSFVRYGIFLPASVGVLFLLVSGLILFFQPLGRVVRSRRR
jgi:uncharacterized iron-regulated membrane protein